jgi:hypothetical protein
VTPTKQPPPADEALLRDQIAWWTRKIARTDGDDPAAMHRRWIAAGVDLGPDATLAGLQIALKALASTFKILHTIDSETDPETGQGTAS